MFRRNQHRHPRSPNPRTKTPLIYAVYLILRTQADSLRIPINTELTEQKGNTPDAAENRGIQNVGVSICTIVDIYRYVCVCVCVCVRALVFLRYVYHKFMYNFQKNNHKSVRWK